jgi:hypothetical protein
VKVIESDPKLKDPVLTVPLCHMHILMNPPAFKAIENHIGVAPIKQAQLVTQPGSWRRIQE